MYWKKQTEKIDPKKKEEQEQITSIVTRSLIINIINFTVQNSSRVKSSSSSNYWLDVIQWCWWLWWRKRKEHLQTYNKVEKTSEAIIIDDWTSDVQIFIHSFIHCRQNTWPHTNTTLPDRIKLLASSLNISAYNMCVRVSTIWWVIIINIMIK